MELAMKVRGISFEWSLRSFEAFLPLNRNMLKIANEFRGCSGLDAFIVATVWMRVTGNVQKACSCYNFCCGK